MIPRMIRADLRRSRGVTAMLGLLMVLAALLAATGVAVVVTLTGAVGALSDAARTPDLVQMHSGAVGDADRARIAEFASGRGEVVDHQVQPMLTVDKSALLFRGVADPEDTQDISLVTQNPRFDLLLDLENRVLHVAPGEIAIPLYYRERHDLEVGDPVTIRTPGIERTLTIGSFLRDSAMNPGLASSKRLLVHETDAAALAPHLTDAETLVEFRLAPGTDPARFQDEYRAADLPAAGIAVTAELFRTMSVINDGAVAAVVILVSVLLLVVSALCLRFAFLTAAEEDRREIGVMKAIGVPTRTVRLLYLARYAAIAGPACVAGYLGSLAVTPPLVENIALYNGIADLGARAYLVPLVPVLVVFALLMAFCLLLTRRIDKVAVVEALVAPAAAGAGRSRMSLHRARHTPVPVRLGVMDVLGRARTYLVSVAVFVVSAFIVILPVNLATTVADDSFMSYLGLAPADVRVDLRNTTGDMSVRFAEVERQVAGSPDVDRYAALVTGGFDLRDPEDGSWTQLAVENGDHTVFPLDYLRGSAPTEPDQIALSWAEADAVRADVGGTVRLRDTAAPGAPEHDLTVTGVYQDVTNGGRTAKGALPRGAGRPLWYVVNADLRDGVDVDAVPAEWGERFAPGRVASTAKYTEQSMGETLARVRTAAVFSVIVGAALAAVMTALFTQMLLARDRAAVAIQSALGAANSQLRVQYLTRMWVVLAVGVVAGTLSANLLGPYLVSGVTRMLGAAHLSFVVSPWLAYVVCPAVLVGVVGLAALAATTRLRPETAARLSVE